MLSMYSFEPGALTSISATLASAQRCCHFGSISVGLYCIGRGSIARRIPSMTCARPLAVLLLLSLPLSGQTLSETVEVHVLEVEAVVLDRAGNPVRGLTRADFEVTVAGEPVDVTNFYAVDGGR